MQFITINSQQYEVSVLFGQQATVVGVANAVSFIPVVHPCQGAHAQSQMTNMQTVNNFQMLSERFGCWAAA